jgi:hypothetical protein
MIIVNEDNSIYVTRGDDVSFGVSVTIDEAPVVFQKGEKLHFKVYEKKNCDNVVIDKTITITEAIDSVQIRLTDEETKIGDTINKPVDYWYEIEYIDNSGNIQTVVGYDEDGAKIFRLFPEGAM